MKKGIVSKVDSNEANCMCLGHDFIFIELGSLYWPQYTNWTFKDVSFLSINHAWAGNYRILLRSVSVRICAVQLLNTWYSIFNWILLETLVPHYNFWWVGFCRCSVWPSSLLLSEFILSCPEIFSNKSCFEVSYLLHYQLSWQQCVLAWDIHELPS